MTPSPTIPDAVATVPQADRFSAVRGVIEEPACGRVSFGELRLGGWIATADDSVMPVVLVDGKRLEHLQWSEFVGELPPQVSEGERVRRFEGAVTLAPETAAADGMLRIELRHHDSVADRRVCRLPHRELPTPPPLVLFMHIPKCAGTTLRVQLEQAIGFPRFRPLYPPKMEGVTLEQLASEVAPESEVVYGHFWHGLHRHLGRPTRSMTVLRDPFELILSQYFFAKYRLRTPAIAACESIFEAMERHPVTFDNVMTRWLGGEPLAKRADATLLVRAKAALDADFDLVGFVEHMPDTCTEVTNALGVPVDTSLHNESPRSTERAMLDLGAFRAAARPFAELDMNLYAHARLRSGHPVAADRHHRGLELVEASPAGVAGG